ncbi:predicted protein [Nematostella vectensis]|uniref:Uncharacterized protein n=1 Tax=Nematostella vectensis TaxID=45351 RepID=A7S0G4_NEMVE|nr:predicted protein [Nematostella vectensis]|eukprot:XP_001634932.1 predicted protein [Nematostella vectensis]
MAYRAKAIRILGIFQSVIGVLMIVVAIPCIIVHDKDFSSIMFGFGISVGVWSVITGVLGFIGASNNNNTLNRWLIGTILCFAVTACVICGIMIFIDAMLLSHFRQEPSTIANIRSVERREKINVPEDIHDDAYYEPRLKKAKTFICLLAARVSLAVVMFFLAMASCTCGYVFCSESSGVCDAGTHTQPSVAPS